MHAFEDPAGCGEVPCSGAGSQQAGVALRRGLQARPLQLPEHLQRCLMIRNLQS